MRARTGRLLVAGLLAVAGVAAVVQAASPLPSQAAAQPVAQPPAQEGTWYCPVTGGARDRTVLSVAAAGGQPSRVTVVRYGPSGPRASQPVTLRPGRVHETALAPGSAGPLTVRWSGGAATAAVRLVGPDGTASLPCEPGPQQQWLLAGLDTASGSRSLLHLYNPYATDAVVQVSFATDDGHVERLAGDALLVPAHDVLRVELGHLEPERVDLGVIVRVRTGRVIAAGELRMTPPEGLTGPSGRALLRAVPAAHPQWLFADARQDDTADSWLALLNPGEVDATVEVGVSDPLPGGGALDAEVHVPAGHALRVPLAEASAAPAFGVQVRSLGDAGVVAALVTDARGEQGRDLSAVTGLPVADDRGSAHNRASGLAEPDDATSGSTAWSLVGAGTAVADSTVTVHNPAAETATVSVDAPGAPTSWTDLRVAPNARVELRGAELAEHQAPPAVAFTVSADRPVVAEVRVTTGGAAGFISWQVGGLPPTAWSGPARRPPVLHDPQLPRRPVSLPQPQQ